MIENKESTTFESKLNGYEVKIIDGEVYAFGFGRLLRKIPVEQITDVVSQKQFIPFKWAVKATVYTNGTKLTMAMLLKDYYRFLEAIPKATPHELTMSNRGWWNDLTRTTHVAVYKDQKQAAREIEQASKWGWTPQTSAAQNGKFGVGKALVGGALVGPVGLLAGAVGNKDKLTITFVRNK